MDNYINNESIDNTENDITQDTTSEYIEKISKNIDEFGKEMGIKTEEDRNIVLKIAKKIRKVL